MSVARRGPERYRFRPYSVALAAAQRYDLSVQQLASVEHIEVTPGVAGGRPRVAGHRFRVQDIVVLHEGLGPGPDEIVMRHPELTLADVYAALAYDHDHLDEIRRYIEEDDSFAEAMRARATSKVV